MTIHGAMMIIFAISIFLSAFLLFQIEPMIGKLLLPWFGGTPALWSTLMLVYQALLTGGYAYATWLTRRVQRPTRIHIGILLVAIALVGARGLAGGAAILPTISAAVPSDNAPILEIVKLLFSSVAFPFFILAANGPLMQAWFSQIYPARSYARLYALSNVGSLLGLLSYPVLVEPNFSLRSQGWIWSIGFLCFGCLVAIISLQMPRDLPPSLPMNSATSGERPSVARHWLWIALSATASIMLLSITNQISQEVAVIPFLWILPLTIYLLSFILTFSGTHGYNRKAYAILFVFSTAATLFVMLHATGLHIYWQILSYCLLLFTVCMLCHGEVYSLRPAAQHLTTFYLMVSIGGALGGIFVCLLAPQIFSGYWEFFVGLSMAIAILLNIIHAQRDVAARARFVLTTFALVLVLLTGLSFYSSEVSYSKRNFYGVIRIRQAWVGNPPKQAYLMSNGITVHGLQFISDLETSDIATTYYVPDSGVGLAILNHPAYGNHQRVGLLGLGVGTLLAYSRPGDVYRLYEINPAVIGLAAGVGDYFFYANDSQAEIIMVPGDARISLQRELKEGHAQSFDVLVLDTFSSDSIPVHLVTKEAFAVYLAHLAPNGILAAHITNLHLDLQPVFWQLAQYYGLSMVRINYEGDSHGGFASHWILLAPDPTLLQRPAIRARAVDLTGYSTHIKLWTDDYSNLFQILK